MVKIVMIIHHHLQMHPIATFYGDTALTRTTKTKNTFCIYFYLRINLILTKSVGLTNVKRAIALHYALHIYTVLECYRPFKHKSSLN